MFVTIYKKKKKEEERVEKILMVFVVTLSLHTLTHRVYGMYNNNNNNNTTQCSPFYFSCSLIPDGSSNKQKREPWISSTV